MTFWPDALHLVALLRGDGCVQECLCADAVSAIEGYQAKIESDAKVIAALGEALKLGRECVVESFDYAKTLDDTYLAEARLQAIDAALGDLEQTVGEKT